MTSADKGEEEFAEMGGGLNLADVSRNTVKFGELNSDDQLYK